MSRPTDSSRSEGIALAGDLIGRNLARPTSAAQWRGVLETLKAKDRLAPFGSYTETGAFLEGLATGRADVGVPLILTIHYLLCRKVLSVHAPEILKEIVGGAGLCAMAASEPGVGSHPKKITTTATREGEGWLLSGHKVFTTGGPLAAYLLVLAVCGESAEGRDLGLFIVPTSAGGVSVKEMPTHPRLESAPHGDITLEGVRVPLAARIGGEGARENGWSRIVKPFRQWEDALLQSWVAGLAVRYATESAQVLASSETLIPALGRLLAAARALATLARDSAQSLDDEETGADQRDLTARRYGFFEQLRQTEALVSEIAGAIKETPEPLQRLRGVCAQAGFAARARAAIVAALVPGSA